MIIWLKRQNGSRHLVTRRGWLLVFVLAACAAADAAAQTPAVQYAPADIQYGSRVYAGQCVVCHGATGDTVAGVDLSSNRFRRATNDNELMVVIMTGLPGTAMPPFKFSPAELTGVIAYLRNMREFKSTVALGDPARGQALFDGKGRCGTCHRVNGKGPRVAPDLSDVGLLRTADALQRAMLEPSTSMQSVNRSVRAVTRDGKVISGRRLNEDTYTLQVIDDQERLVSVDKADLKASS